MTAPTYGQKIKHFKRTVQAQRWTGQARLPEERYYALPFQYDASTERNVDLYQIGLVVAQYPATHATKPEEIAPYRAPVLTAAGSTTTVLTVASVGFFQVGDVIDVAGEDRTITAVNAAAKTITVGVALTAAPAAGVAVTSVELGEPIGLILDTRDLETELNVPVYLKGAWDSGVVPFVGIDVNSPSEMRKLNARNWMGIVFWDTRLPVLA